MGVNMRKELSGGRYLKAIDVEKPMLLTMSDCRQEVMPHGDEEKWVLFFHESEQGLVLNKVNTETICDAYGDDSDAWMRKKIVLFKSSTQMQGKTVPCIRVRLPKPGSKAAQELPPDDPTVNEVADDDIPF